MSQGLKRLLALLLALMLCIAMIPAALAEDGGSISLVDEDEPDEESGTIQFADETEQWRADEDIDVTDGDAVRLPLPDLNALPPEPAVLDATYSGTCGSNLKWTLTDGVLTITGSGAMTDWTLGNAPWDDYSLTITTINLPSGLTSIGNYAFYFCAYVKSLTIPSGVTKIGSNAFDSCLQLKTVSLPATLTTIGSKAFYDCMLLSSVTIPANVTSIGASAFTGCVSLSSIGVNSSNNTYSSQDGILYNKAKTTLVQCPCGRSGAVTVPSSVTQIGESSFEYCIFVTSVSIPTSVTSIGSYAFDSCYSMTDINVASANTTYCSKNGVLYNKAATSLIKYPGGKDGDFTVPSGVTGIASWAFYDSYDLPCVTIPASVTTIGIGAFAKCDRLAQVWFLGGAPSIKSYAFGLIYTMAFYPETNSTWTSDMRQDYGGDVSWVPCRNGTPVNPFKDVKASHYFYYPVLWAYYHDAKITGGTDATHFSPNATCTREQIVTFLWVAAGSPEPDSTTNPFKDVKSSKYYYKAVLWAVENGITAGVDDTHFGVGKPCTREQAMTFLWVAAGSPEPRSTTSPFPDVKSKHYFYKAVLWAVDNGITGGTPDGTFGVGQPCTRAQIMTFLYKFLVA